MLLKSPSIFYSDENMDGRMNVLSENVIE